ncbi:ribosome-associated toxin RatA of RatAB toxin-antitoxin module [Parabacteroides sp. PF5-5]|uniref:hypothetical protein n=1 Tax=unclassified Parabacteroides TaxID=2649774 RepID=UPI002474CB93|nr:MULTISPECIES: hypothetical protein [unclassified Parabacteroides]MDH6304835.1 ribosome-associated toxin RatA of RatAB toxin-antitoxin module [Parabacteroides sp. PH5-39]MDH6316079.1 ribosome-associated toxin RatA of RatAB toxin-antitoxin module [Parabacteroides sp. PF5-13]MDH6319736.1 ribosome-associated toxin RatA of RatAB toxin-antitoxin module [Parabacteroides sp. PH5-13]MDH6323467.1 ribosome-associated toxin RatA of RatAB toxin-antitoxin module [Parabacteroides sp. PH5-8]MDH6327025.1 ri
MSKSVSNDALWEKLSEIEGTIKRYLKEQKEFVPKQEQADITSQLRVNKDEIVKKIEKYIQGLGTHCDSHFKSIYTNLGQLDEHTHGIYEILSNMWGIMRESEEQTKVDGKSYLNFKFFKLRKSSLVIVVLGLLVFILTLFCMKQQNDYTLLNQNYYQQSIDIRAIQAESDSLKSTLTNHSLKK